jgi:rhodanese-related sulfurtransferase
MTLPDSLTVYPTHGSGSFCAATPTGERTTTIGHERSSNPLLQAVDENDFVARATRGLGTYPSYFLRLRAVNRAGAPIYGPFPPPLIPRTPDQVAESVKGGAEIVDLRPIAQYAAGHLPGSLSIELRPQFGSWLGWLVDPGREVIFIADPDQDLADAVIQSLNVGYERLGGYLADGITGWQHSGRSVAHTRLLHVDEVSPDLTIVDVRQASEWNADHVPGAAHLELGAIADHGVGLAGDLVLHCGHGQRSMTAASLLERAGHTNVSVTSASAQELTRAIARPTR